MATIKNFGIVGIGQSVQYGKGGGKVVYDTGNSLFKITTDGTTLTNLDVADPTNDTHAASKGYVDSVAQGLDVKDSVRAASATDINTTSAPSSIDGVTLSSGDRVLLKDQATASQNGIYVFNGTGAALTRAVDMDEAGEFVGAFFFVEEGTQNSDQGFVCTTNGTVQVGVTNISFSQFTGTGQISPGAGLSKSANTINVNVDGTFIEINGNDALTIKGTATTGEVLKSNGSGGVVYGAVDLANSNAVSGVLPLANGGLGTEASTVSGKTTARTNLGLGTIATQDANNVAITGGSIDISGGTLTLADNQINGNKVSGGTIDSANLLGGAGNTISGYDLTVGSGKTLDVDGVLDVDGAAGSAIDNVAIGGTTSAAGTFSTLTSGNVDLNGGNIDGTIIGAAASAAGTFSTLSADVGTVLDLDVNSITEATVGNGITVNGDTSFTNSVGIAATETLSVDTINETTSAAGVTVDGVLLKDGNVTANVVTMNSGGFSTVDIDGGTIDGTVIGGATPAAGTFTDLASNNVTITGGTISGTNVNMTGQTLTLDNDSISGDKVHGGVISNFASTGIDDNTTSTMLVLTSATGSPASVTGTVTNPTVPQSGSSIIINGTVIDFGISGGSAPFSLTNIINDINSAAIQGVTASNDGSGKLVITDVDSDLVISDGNNSPLAGLGIASGTYTYTPGSNGTAAFSDDVTIAGNLTVSGTLTSIQTTNTEITDNTIVLNNGESGAGVTAGSAGIEIDRGSLDSATILWNETTDVFELKVGAALADLKVANLAMTGISADQIGSLSGNGITITDDISGLDATFSGSVSVDTINEVTAATGVTVDGVLLKDGVVTGGLTAEVGDIVDVSAGTLTLANDQISGDSIEGGTIGSITIDSLTSGSVDINGGNIDATTIGAAASAAGTFSTMTSSSVAITGGAIDGTAIGATTSSTGVFSTLTTSSADINGGNGDNFIIGATTSAAGTFSTMTSDTVDINGGTIDGVALTTSTVDINGGAIDGTIIGANTSAAGTFSVLTTQDAQITGGSITGVTTGSFTNLSSTNVNFTGGTISGVDIDLTGSTLVFDNDSISGNAIHGGTISESSLAGAGVATMTGYDITVGAGRTLNVSAGTLTLANDQISGDKVHGGTISNFASTGIDDNATATKVTLTDTTATFGVAGDFGANTLAAGATTLASLNVTGNAVISGDLTVSGSVTTTLSETVEIEDNLILLNSNHTGAATQDAGIEVNRGTEVGGNAKWYWDETNDEWSSNGANINVGSISSSSFSLTGTIATTDGGTGTDTSGFADDSLMIMSGTGTAVSELAKGANSTVLKVNASGALGYAKVALTTDVSGTLPIANGGTGLATNGSDRQLLVVDATGALGYEYVGTLRNSTGLATINTSNMASGTGEYLEVTNGTGRVTVTAKNSANSGIVDLYLQGQDGGDVFLVGDSGEALLQGEADTDLTVAGGDSSAGDAGDLVLKGGNGSGSFISGSVIIKGGIGGATNGNVEILGPNDTAIAVFTETSSTAADNFEFKNGTGGLELAAVGTSTDVNLTLAPKGAGYILAPSGYDMSLAGANALATKSYVDSQISANGDNFIRQTFAANGSSSFAVGTLKNISGQTYYVSRVTVKITTAFVGADELVISDGTNTLVDTLDVDLSETGFFIIDQGFENTSAGGATITATIQNGGASASPTVGNVIVAVEYKAI